MKKVFLVVLSALAALSLNAQSFTDTFDSNTMGWTERSGKDGEAVIKNGVMHLEGKNNGSMWSLTGEASEISTHCFTGLDVQKNFEIKCKALVKKIDASNAVGIIIDYLDDYNYMLFAIDDEYAYFFQRRDGEWVGYIKNDLKIKNKKKAEVEFSIKSTYKRLEFIVNGMLAIDLRFRELQSNGVGFYTFGKQTADFDDLEIIQ